MSTRHGHEVQQVYFRQLPGGGFVVIEATPFRTLFGHRRYRGEVFVERRVEHHRRVGHKPPAVARAEAATVATVLHRLFPIAQSNTVLAHLCLARTRELVEAR